MTSLLVGGRLWGRFASAEWDPVFNIFIFCLPWSICTNSDFFKHLVFKYYLWIFCTQEACLTGLTHSWALLQAASDLRSPEWSLCSHFWFSTFILSRKFSILPTGKEVFVFGFLFGLFLLFVAVIVHFVFSFILLYSLKARILKSKKLAKGDKLKIWAAKLSQSPWIYPNTLKKEMSKSHVLPPAQGWRIHLFL